MKKFAKYRLELEQLVGAALELGCGSDPAFQTHVRVALDGGPSCVLHRVIPVEVARSKGSFFTPAAVADRAVAPLFGLSSAPMTFVDPTCGAGDLLLACARRLPLASTPGRTIRAWGQQLHGSDLVPEFVATARLRLTLLAALRHGFQRIHVPDEAYPFIREGDGLEVEIPKRANLSLLVNPPYAYVITRADCEWAQGRVNGAAVFLERLLSKLGRGTNVIAILPEVLRTGSRYAKWRDQVQEVATIRRIKSVGRFSRWADVDVFVTHLVVGSSGNGRRRSWWKAGKCNHQGRLSDRFLVAVGPVVPHRDPEAGPLRAYVSTTTLPPWGKVQRVTQRRQYAGTVFTPPFVTVRRTSRPGTRFRAVGTLVLGKRPVAVENHLLVLQPRDKSLRTCERLLIRLKSSNTTDWLNRRLRCRHLTVGALRSLPWWMMSK